MAWYYYSLFGEIVGSSKPISYLTVMPNVQVAGINVHWHLSYQEEGVRKDKRSEAIYWRQDQNNGHSLTISYSETQELLCFEYSVGVTFFVHQTGSNIWIAANDQLSPTIVSLYFLGPIIGFVLRLRGVLCLHASVAAVNGNAVAFLGPAGSGKSTLVASMAMLGWSILSDDILALRYHNGLYWAQPAYGYIHLRPPSVQSFFDSTEALPLTVTGSNKRSLILEPYQFQKIPLPLKTVYILGIDCHEATEPYFEFPPLPKVLIDFLANRFTTKVLSQEMIAEDFNLLSDLLPQLSLRRISPNVNLAYLPQITTAILADQIENQIEDA